MDQGTGRGRSLNHIGMNLIECGRSVLHWFDSQAPQSNTSKEKGVQIDWIRVLPFVLIHVVAGDNYLDRSYCLTNRCYFSLIVIRWLLPPVAVCCVRVR